MKKSYLPLLMAAGIFGGGAMPEVKIKNTRPRSDFKPWPPRSMSPEHEAYYNQHKTLDGFYPRKKTA